MEKVIFGRFVNIWMSKSVWKEFKYIQKSKYPTHGGQKKAVEEAFSEWVEKNKSYYLEEKKEK